MKILEKALISLAVILFILIIIAFLLPAKWHVQRSIVINAPSTAIDLYVSDLKKWPEWNSDKIGTRVLTITKADPNLGIWYIMSINNDKMPATGAITYQTQGQQTKVTWDDEGELGNNPVNRYLGLLITPMHEIDLEKSLASLKQIIENQNK